jgi:hypothetical protein
MSKCDDGGPAFPGYWENDSEVNAAAPDGKIVPPMTQHGISGMSLRDYFAAQAINAALTMKVSTVRSSDEAVKVATEACYAMADAMLEARKR